MRFFENCPVAVILMMATSASFAGQSIDYPHTRKSVSEDRYHGTVVREDYRWLENAANPEVHAWSLKQNEVTQNYLDGLQGTDAIRERVSTLMNSDEVVFHDVVCSGGKYFALKHQPPHQQSFLVVFDDPNSPDDSVVLFDPNSASHAGAISIDWFEPSFDGKYVAISLSSDGSEAGDAHVYEVETGKPVFEVIPRVNTGTAGGDLAWAPDNSGFYYTRHPREGEKPKEDLNFFQQVYFHKLGTPTENDRFEMGKGFPRIAENEVEVEPVSGQVLLTVQDGDGGEFSHYLRSAKGEWRQFSTFGDKTLQATFAGPDTLFVMSCKDAPRGKILKVSTDTLDMESAPVVVPETEFTIVNSFYREPPSIVATDSKLYVLYQKGGPSMIKTFDHNGNEESSPKQEVVSNVGGMDATGVGDQIIFSASSYTHPLYFYQFDPVDGETTKLSISTQSSVDFSDIIVRREFAVSKDGTKIPVNILLPEGVNDSGAAPFIVYGYGGYGVNITPRFNKTLRVLFDHGFGYAVANIRGGGEFGEEWHQQGMLTEKQNVFDDFTAACEYVIDKGYTDREHLSIMGGSNGGLLMGALLTQRPNLVKAVVSYVGIYDMLRVELSPNGSFNIPEFGTVKNPEHFKALHAYSPYHNVEDDTEYPAVLFLTGANDPRVDPMQSRKMTARLQAATKSNSPILLRTSFNAGHGRGTPLSERVEQTVAVYQFLIHQLKHQK